MSDRPLLTATLIAKNEKANVKRCLDSLWDHVDQVCVTDTGSTDGTLAEFRRYAKRRGQPDKLKTRTFTDCNDEHGDMIDFAAARQACDELATGEFLVWCDMDDEVRGLDTLRDFAEKASDEVIAFFVRYRYAADVDSNPISELWRERVVRNDGTRWQGRLHEHKTFTHGAVVRVSPSDAEWIHHRDHTQRTGDRNLRVLKTWIAEEPENPRVVQSIAMEYMGSEQFKEASDMFSRYLDMPGEPPDRRAQATRHMCVMLMLQGRVAEARKAAFGSLEQMWLWADTHLTLAECAQTAGRPEEGIVHARTALGIGQPDTLLISNPLQYTAHPRAILAICLAQLGRVADAVAMAEEALEIAPSYPLVTQHLPRIRAQLRKDQTVGTLVALADVLIESGEPLKARAMLDQAPWYVAEDARIVARREQTYRLIGERQATPGVLPEDAAADAFIARHSEAA